MIVDPAEEKLKNEFSAVKRSFIPMQSVVRIDEVEKEGACKISEAPQGGNVSPFPFPNMAGGKPRQRLDCIHPGLVLACWDFKLSQKNPNLRCNKAETM